MTVIFNENIDAATINTKSSILIQELNSIAGTVTPAISQTDTSASSFFQIANLNFSNFIFVNPKTHSSPIN